MTAWCTIGLVAGRELRARRKAAALVIGATVAVVGVGLAIVSLSPASGADPAALAPEDADELMGFLGTIALFLAIIFTGQIIVLGVAEEKNSRVVEVVLGTMRARHLLTGKVLAIGLLGLAEVAVAAGALVAAGSAFDIVELPDATAGAAVAVVVWFVLGYAFYAVLYAAAGSLVARAENVANASVPLNFAVVVGYFVALSQIDSPGSGLLRWASLFPPLAPLTMPMRMINGSVAAWEVALAAALTLVAAYGLVRLGGRIYAGSVMQPTRVGWRRALHSAVSS